MRLAVVLVFAFVALGVADAAHAIPPVLQTVGTDNRHPNATLSAPHADFATIYLAKKPDRASDGAFLSENIEVIDVLTDAEIQSGRWSYESQVEPGTYYVMMRASPDFDACYIYGEGRYNPACADGYSNVVTLNVPIPKPRYVGTARVYRFLRQVSLRLAAAPLGVRQSYKVCFTDKSRKRRCVSGTLRGYDWNSGATSDTTVGTRKLQSRTIFTWYVNGKPVAATRVRI
jgi:hypothetical protein